MNRIIKLYGTERCHKTKYYQTFLKNSDVNFIFLDVEKNNYFAHELKALYKNKKLNFPTIAIGNKKFRNPSDNDLRKWLDKLKNENSKIKNIK